MKSQEDKQQYIHCSYDVLLQRRKKSFWGRKTFFNSFGWWNTFLSMRNLFLFPLVDERLFWSYWGFLQIKESLASTKGIKKVSHRLKTVFHQPGLKKVSHGVKVFHQPKECLWWTKKVFHKKKSSINQKSLPPPKGLFSTW